VPTVQDVAHRANVSTATVSHVLNGTRYVSPELIARVRHAVLDLDYHPNGIARSLKTQKTQLISLIISDITNPFFSCLVRGAERALSERGYGLLVCNTDENTAMESKYLGVSLQKGVDGIILVPTGKDNEGIQRLIRRDLPVVFADRIVPGVDADAVLSDNMVGAYQAVKHLIDWGHRRIGVIGGLERVTAVQERIAGYMQVLQEFGLKLNDDLIASGGSKMEGGYEACCKLLNLSTPPTAIFSTNNLMLRGALKAFKAHGIAYPHEVSIVGFDDFAGAALYNPSLTVVNQQADAIGFKAAELLMQQLKEGKRRNPTLQTRLATQLIVRESVASPMAKPGRG